MKRRVGGLCSHLLLLAAMAVMAAAAALASSCSAFQTLGSSEYTRELQQSGVPGPAAVLSMEDTLEAINDNPIVRLVVEVRPVNGQPYQASIRRLVVTPIQAFQFQPGKVIAVRYDPRDPSRVAVDLGRQR